MSISQITSGAEDIHATTGNNIPTGLYNIALTGRIRNNRETSEKTPMRRRPVSSCMLNVERVRWWWYARDQRDQPAAVLLKL